MTETKPKEGGCLCGAVRFRIAGAPRDVAYCHCRMCQKASGAPVMAWASYAPGQVSFTSQEPRYYRSSEIAERGFCPNCGTPVIWRPVLRPGDTRPDTVDIALTCLDDPAALAPQYHIWTESQVTWLHLADTLPRHRQAGPG